MPWAASDDPGAPLVPVAKKSSGGKTSVGGRKWAARRLDAYGVAEAEVVGTGPVPDALADRQLLVELVKGGEAGSREPLDAARDRHAAARAGLPLVRDPALPGGTRPSDGVRARGLG
ncbi:hypothetical protein SFUMM280S_06468 [Streptomyces fumanus]